MALDDHIPGMRSGRSARNVIVAILYTLGFPFLLAFLPPFVAYWIGRNSANWADKLHAAGLPGIDAGGGMKSGVVGLVYGIALWALFWYVVWTLEFAGPGVAGSGNETNGSTTLPPPTDAASVPALPGPTLLGPSSPSPADWTAPPDRPRNRSGVVAIPAIT